MYNAPPPHLMQGINLVQAGQKSEALIYLRHAARHEPLTAEGWLWLAAATDDLDEYTYSVDRALHLDPRHPTAAHMRDDLNRLAGWGRMADASGSAGDLTIHPELATQYRVHRLSRTRRALRALVLLVISVICLGSAGVFALSGVVQDFVRDRLNHPKTHALDFTVGQPSGFRFRVEVPDSWLPANTDDPAWRTARDTLQAEFPGAVEQVETSFSAAQRDPVYGDILPKARLVETNPKRLREAGLVAALTLHSIVPLPDLPAGSAEDVCARMRLLEAEFKVGGGETAPGSTLVEEKVAIRRTGGDCVFVVHRRYTGRRPDQVPFPLDPDHAPDRLREITLAVPVGTDRYAVWQITLADSTFKEYKHTVERIIQTLETSDAG